MQETSVYSPLWIQLFELLSELASDWIKMHESESLNTADRNDSLHGDSKAEYLQQRPSGDENIQSLNKR